MSDMTTPPPWIPADVWNEAVDAAQSQAWRELFVEEVGDIDRCVRAAVEVLREWVTPRPATILDPASDGLDGCIITGEDRATEKGVAFWVSVAEGHDDGRWYWDLKREEWVDQAEAARRGADFRAAYRPTGPAVSPEHVQDGKRYAVTVEAECMDGGLWVDDVYINPRDAARIVEIGGES